MISSIGSGHMFTVTIDSWKAFHDAARYGDLELVKQLASTVDLNKQDEAGVTAFHSAVEKDHLHVVEYLLNLDGVEVDTPDKDGTTPLMTACGLSSLAVIKSLLNSGRFDVNAQNDNGDSIEDFLEGRDAAQQITGLLKEYGLVPSDHSDGSNVSYSSD